MGLRTLEFLLFAAAALLQGRVGPRWMAAHPESRWRSAVLVGSYAVLGVGFVVTIPWVSALFSWIAWIRGAALAWAIWLMVICAVYAVSSRVFEFDPGRRKLLLATQAAVCVTPVIATGIGVLVRKEFAIREVEIALPGLPADLNGLRMVQISDIHLGPFLLEHELERVVDMANETRAHIALVTGDLITTHNDPLDAAIRQISRLKADAGVYSCLGNHERYAEVEDYTADQCRRIGIEVLRNDNRQLKFGSAILNVAGVDYQSTRDPYLDGTERLVSTKPNHFNMLLSHNPDVFPVAVRQGFGLTIAGHTHGGQVSVEILHKHVNVARFFTPYTYGMYRMNQSAIYVTRGIGTVGIPARIGAPPEVALIKLCAS
jgi:predicted MPP superfamily phosphohydrolase